MYTEYIFPTPIGITSVDYGMCDVYARKIEHVIETGKFFSNPIGLCKTTTEDLLLDPEFNDIADVIRGKVSELTSDAYGINPSDLQMKSMWANIHDNYFKHHFHNHANSFISGALYLEVPPEAEHPGSISFTDPRQAKHTYHADFVKDSCLSNRTWVYKPITGMMLIFPGWLEHGTEEYFCSSGKKRIVLSFNFALTKCSSVTMKL